MLDNLCLLPGFKSIDPFVNVFSLFRYYLPLKPGEKIRKLKFCYLFGLSVFFNV